MATELAVLRQAIEMYRVQHGQRIPDDLALQLTTGTSRDGSPGGNHGSCLRHGIPVNGPVSRSAGAAWMASAAMAS